jgi:hypothetical protein
MKKLITLVAVAGMFAFTACGPSAEEKAAMDKARQDSIEAVQKAEQEKMEAEQKAKEEMEKARQDSTDAANKAKQDSIDNAMKNKKTTKPAAPKKDVKPVGKG